MNNKFERVTCVFADVYLVPIPWKCTLLAILIGGSSRDAFRFGEIEITKNRQIRDFQKPQNQLTEEFVRTRQKWKKSQNIKMPIECTITVHHQPSRRVYALFRLMAVVVCLTSSRF